MGIAQSRLVFRVEATQLSVTGIIAPLAAGKASQDNDKKKQLSPGLYLTCTREVLTRISVLFPSRLYVIFYREEVSNIIDRKLRNRKLLFCSIKYVVK